jgi:hypothetical protein
MAASMDRQKFVRCRLGLEWCGLGLSRTRRRERMGLPRLGLARDWPLCRSNLCFRVASPRFLWASWKGRDPTMRARRLKTSMKSPFVIDDQDGELDGTQVTNLKRIQTLQVQQLRERPSTQHEVARPLGSANSSRRLAKTGRRMIATSAIKVIDRVLSGSTSQENRSGIRGV